MIELTFDQYRVDILVNDQPCSVENFTLHLHEVNDWTLLKFDSTESIKITDCKIQGRSIGYLMFIMFRDDKTCCFGHIGPGQSSYLPIHSSYAVFRSEVCSQLNNGWFGKQIYENFDFSLDSGVQISTAHPPHMQDFFALPSGPHWLEKYNYNTPWFIGPEIDLKQLVNELKLVNVPVQYESADTNQHWIMRHVKNPNLKELGLDYLYSIAKEVGFETIDTLSFNTLGPQGHIGIHRDGDCNTQPRQKLYINLDPDDRVFFKFFKGGLVPMNTNRSMWVNTDGYVHAVVNDSSASRNIVSIAGIVKWPTKT